MLSFITDYSKCTGCFACMNICPHSAITVGNGYLDKSIPVIDSKKCVECGLCQSICPVNNPVPKNKVNYSIAAWSKNDKDKKLSSSGGVASAFAREVLRKNGIVFGTTNEGKDVRVISITKENEIDKLRGSKYVQSNVGLIFREVKKNLKQEKRVLFISTPCQVAGLKNYLQKDYENLVTVDLICHGVPPQKYLSNHVDAVLKNKKADKIQFRGEFDYMLTAYNDKRIVYQKKSAEDYYFSAFLDSMILRDNCYECPYSRIERCADITIGDFWGLDKTKLKNKYSGKVSVVLPNTDKGVRFFEECCDNFVWEQRSIEEACNKYQGNLLHPSIPSKDRKTFEEKYAKYGFEKTIKKYTILGKNIRKNKIYNKLHRCLLFRACKKVFIYARGLLNVF